MTEAPVQVTFLSSHARPGGSERYLLILLDQLGAGWVHDIVVLEDGPLVDRLRNEGFSPTIIPTSAKKSSVFLAGLRLRRLLMHRRPALVHANGVKAALVAVLATLGSRIPIVWLKHDVSRDGRAARFIASRCTRVVGVSSFVMQIFGSNRDDRKYRVVHTGLPRQKVDHDLGRRKVLEAVASSDPVSVVGLVGRLDAFKGHRDLIEAAPKVLERHPAARFLLVGGASPDFPGMEASLRDLADRAGVSDVVHFAGYRDDALDLIAGFDVGVIPSAADPTGMYGREGFSLVGLEYLACGTPMVAYDGGGLGEVMGECGVLVPEKDREALADAINALLADERQRLHLGECGKQRVETLFRLEKMVDALTGIYREVAL
jgi:glycosyltransferase involved in cell wall biosynthesis